MLKDVEPRIKELTLAFANTVIIPDAGPRGVILLPACIVSGVPPAWLLSRVVYSADHEQANQTLGVESFI